MSRKLEPVSHLNFQYQNWIHFPFQYSLINETVASMFPRVYIPSFDTHRSGKTFSNFVLIFSLQSCHVMFILAYIVCRLTF